MGLTLFLGGSWGMASARSRWPALECPMKQGQLGSKRARAMNLQIYAAYFGGDLWSQEILYMLLFSQRLAVPEFRWKLKACLCMSLGIDFTRFIKSSDGILSRHPPKKVLNCVSFVG